MITMNIYFIFYLNLSFKLYWFQRKREKEKKKKMYLRFSFPGVARDFTLILVHPTSELKGSVQKNAVLYIN